MDKMNAAIMERSVKMDERHVVEPSIYTRCVGGLGNQLFQYWTAFALAWKNRCPLVLDASGGPWHQRPKVLFRSRRPFRLDGFRDMEIERRRLRWVGPWVFERRSRTLEVRKESGHSFDERVLRLKPPVYLSGYWQSPRYFEDLRGKMLDDMVPRDIPDHLDALIRTARQSAVTSIHVRRGDYLSNLFARMKHSSCSMEYYNKAVSRLKGKTETFFMFTDDVPWCEKNFKHLKNMKVISGSLDNELHELHLMSKCRNNIIANSTFSWWAAWINKHEDKTVIAPKQWFRNKKMSTKDLCPESWIRI